MKIGRGKSHNLHPDKKYHINPPTTESKVISQFIAASVVSLYNR
jgi:hypothetical protein